MKGKDISKVGMVVSAAAFGANYIGYLIIARRVPTFDEAYDNSEVPATGDDFKNVLKELIAAQLAMWQHKNELFGQIDAATTPEQIKSIKWIW